LGTLSIKSHLTFLMETGVRETDCYYKYGIFAMYGGRK